MNRFKLFLENFLAYGFINILNKIIPLIMLPIVTRMLTDTGDYGRFDMFNTIVNFGSSFAVLGVYDAMFREYFEKDDDYYKEVVTSTALGIVIISSLAVLALFLILQKPLSIAFLGNDQSTFIITTAGVGTLLGALRSPIAAPTRMRNQRLIYVGSGIGNAVVYYALAILLVYLGFGYKGLIYGNLIAGLGLLIYFAIINRKDFNLHLFDKKTAKELLRIGLPLLPTFVIYWAFNSTDKIMITHMLDLAQLGIYSIGARVASISQFIYQAFAGGWQFFAFSTMKDEDQVEMTSNIFEYLGLISFLAFIVLIPMNQWIFNLLFTGDYTQGAIVFPFLFLSPLLLMLVQIAGNQFLVIKKSYWMTISLTAGVLVNLAMNYFMIQIFGIKGCALSTLTGYAVSVIMVVIVTNRMKLLKLRKSFLLISLVMCGLVLAVFFEQWSIVIGLALFCILLMMMGYRRDLKKLFIMVKETKKKEGKE